MTTMDAQDTRIEAIVGDYAETSLEEGNDKFYEHLQASLKIPCDVTGIEDFQWEERYVIGPGDPQEYAELRKEQPSYQDTFELLAIVRGVVSEWMLFYDEDIAAHVRRKSDGKEFYLGLSEIKPVGKKSANRRLMDDYAVWFVNSR